MVGICAIGKKEGSQLLIVRETEGRLAIECLVTHVAAAFQKKACHIRRTGTEQGRGTLKVRVIHISPVFDKSLCDRERMRDKEWGYAILVLPVCVCLGIEQQMNKRKVSPVAGNKKCSS